MALINRVSSRFGSPATRDANNRSYQTALFAERVNLLAALAGFSSNNTGKVPNSSGPAEAETVVDYLVTENNNFLMTENGNNLIT